MSCFPVEIDLQAQANRSKLSYPALGVPITCANLTEAIATVASWIVGKERGKMVTFANVHMLIEAANDESYLKLLIESDMNCPDGMPLVWIGKAKAATKVSRVCGPEFMPVFSRATAFMGIRHFFYGGAEGIAAKAAENLKRECPGMEIAGVYSPPFRPLSLAERDDIVQMINAARPNVVWVSLGCPKQERWIGDYRHRLDANVLLAVGLAMDVVAGSKKRAPKLFRAVGVEWIYRLFQEPQRLWKRYLIYNTSFIIKLFAEVLAEKLTSQ